MLWHICAFSTQYYHKVRINYYPPRNDNKEGWDNIDIFGWLGYPMQGKINFLCRDSILAAPLCRRGGLSVGILRGVVDARLGQCFAPLHTGAALATMLLTATVARPRLSIVDAQLFAPCRYLALCHIAVG